MPVSLQSLHSTVEESSCEFCYSYCLLIDCALFKTSCIAVPKSVNPFHIVFFLLFFVMTIEYINYQIFQLFFLLSLIIYYTIFLIFYNVFYSFLFFRYFFSFYFVFISNMY